MSIILNQHGIAGLPSGGGSILPDGYIQLDYINFSGAPNSNLYQVLMVNTSSKIEMAGKVNWFNTSGLSQDLYTLANTVFVRTRSDDNSIYVKNNNSSPYSNVISGKGILLDDFVMTVNQTVFKINSDISETLTYSSTGGYLTIGANSTDGSNFNLYYFKITNTSNVVTWHAIPAYEISTGKKGVYDIINGNFHEGNNINYGGRTVKIGNRDYKTVIIGNQEWLAENLDYKWSGLGVGGNGISGVNPHAWYYNNIETDYGIDGTYKCGLLYNWWAVKYLEANKSTLLPDGWHVPTKDEYETLITTVGGSSAAGAKLKALDNSVTSSWPTGWNGTDNYGFNALPAGEFNENSYNWIHIGSEAYLMTCTEGTFGYQAGYYTCYLQNSSQSTVMLGKQLSYQGAFSVRLVKDAS